MRVLWFEQFRGEPQDYVPSTHLEKTSRFLYWDKPTELLVLGHVRISNHGMLLDTVRATQDLPDNPIVAGIILGDLDVLIWHQYGLDIKTVDDLKPYLKKALLTA